MFKIAVFASGSGSNAENMVNYFSKSTFAHVGVILSNKKDAYVLKRAERLGVPAETFTYREFQQEDVMLPLLEKYQTDFIILAGFLLKVPDYILERYPERILNVHPSLLPKFGGKGMHGEVVHRSVIEAGEKESGITIHVIDNRYDCGKTIYQGVCAIEEGETAETLAVKIHELEKSYPQVAESYFKSLDK